jgi:hypothetical protein
LEERGKKNKIYAEKKLKRQAAYASSQFFYIAGRIEPSSNEGVIVLPRGPSPE